MFRRRHACSVPAAVKFGMSVRVERPRETSKSAPNSGCLGTRASAEAISFCSSAEGVQTFSMFTFTCGCAEAASGDSWAAILGAMSDGEKTEPEGEDRDSRHAGILNDKARKF